MCISCVFCAPLDRYIGRHLGRHIVRHSTDVSVDIAAECRPIYRYIGWHIGRVAVDMSTGMCRWTYRPMYQPRYRPSDGRQIDRLSADISVDIAADTRPIRWPLIVGGISVERRWYIGQNLNLLVYKLYAFHPFLVNLKKFLKASCSAFMCSKFSRYQARHWRYCQIHKIRLTG